MLRDALPVAGGRWRIDWQRTNPARSRSLEMSLRIDLLGFLLDIVTDGR
jgi:hypothetical protein